MVTTHALNQLYTCPKVFTERNREVFMCSAQFVLYSYVHRTTIHGSNEICHFCENKLKRLKNKLTGLLITTSVTR